MALPAVLFSLIFSRAGPQTNKLGSMHSFDARSGFLGVFKALSISALYSSRTI